MASCVLLVRVDAVAEVRHVPLVPHVVDQPQRARDVEANAFRRRSSLLELSHQCRHLRQRVTKRGVLPSRRPLKDPKYGLRESSTLDLGGPQVVSVEPALRLGERFQQFLHQLGGDARCNEALLDANVEGSHDAPNRPSTRAANARMPPDFARIRRFEPAPVIRYPFSTLICEEKLAWS